MCATHTLAPLGALSAQIPTINALHPTPYTLHPTPYTLKPYTLHPIPQEVSMKPVVLYVCAFCKLPRS